MESHCSLKRTLLQAEIQKNSEKQAFTHSDSKQNGKEIFDLLPSANMRKRVSNIHESTRRFNVASRKNTKEHYQHTTPTNRNPAEPFGTALITYSRPIQRTRARERQVLRHSDSKRKWKETSKVQVSANIGNQISTFKN